MKHLHPPGWVPAKGYANGVAARGTQIFVGGQIGWNAQQQFESDDFIAQTAQTLRNVLAVLAEGGAGPEHMVRMTWYILDRDEYNARLKELGQVFEEIRQEQPRSIQEERANRTITDQDRRKILRLFNF